MMNVAIIGGEGFVGSAFFSYLQKDQADSVNVVSVTYGNFARSQAVEWDVVINAAGNSKKWLAEQDTLTDFDRTVRDTLLTVTGWKCRRYVHLSSVDIYNNVTNPDFNAEDVVIVPENLSRYGFGKYLAELIVRRYAPQWLIVRLGGMVGPNLKKNPIFDLLSDQPLRVHPSSAFQYLHTDNVARIVWSLIERGVEKKTFNLCGDGVLTLAEVCQWLKKENPKNDYLSQHYEVNIDKIKRFATIPSSRETVFSFIQQHIQRSALGPHE